MSFRERFVADGYFIHEFNELAALAQCRSVCEKICKKYFGNKFQGLAQYHLLKVEQSLHDELQFEIYSTLNEIKLHHQFAKDNLSFFTSLLGPDLDIQTNTYLRISRPGKEVDNIGIHRDTDYGNSAYELSVSLPLIDQPKGAGLSIVPASHLNSEHFVKQVNRDDVVKGTNKNEMGFLYAPKIPLSLRENDLREINLKYGQGLGFSLGLMHGQKENKSQQTRWSIDFRLKNTYHPMTKNLKSGYYQPFVSGPLTKVGNKYYEINAAEIEGLKV